LTVIGLVVNFAAPMILAISNLYSAILTSSSLALLHQSWSGAQPYGVAAKQWRANFVN